MGSRRQLWRALSTCALACTGLAACSSAGLERWQPPDGQMELEVVQPKPDGSANPSPLLGILEAEATRISSQVAELDEPRPYFVAYHVTDLHTTSIQASFGGLVQSQEQRTRTLDVDVRVGDPSFDNTHPARGSDLLVRGGSPHPSWQLPLEDDPAMLKRTLWVALDAQYRRALAEYLKVKGNISARAEAEDRANDFSTEPPVQYIETTQSFEERFDLERMQEKIRAFSSLFREYPEIYTSSVSLQADDVTRYLVNSEGSRVQQTRTYARVTIQANTRSDDGMDLRRFESVDLSLDPSLPEEASIRATIDEVIRDLLALRQAPQATPYVGPAILEGRAAGVFAHEVLGHRLEGHRQKADDEGQTFSKKVGERVLPEFIDIYDDPTISVINGTPLNGYYVVDDEAVRTRRASLIEDGRLTGFLLSRSPIPGFDRSNGHGRRQAGNPIVARQGNLIVHPQRTLSKARLKRLLLDEIRRQGKPYGLRFSIVEGGFTNTSRFGIQAFRVLPVMVYRVYPDGREELVRGVSIDGTPLSALSQVIAAADDVQIFNGVCGAESGYVPVSAVSPSLLLRRVETSGVLSMRNRAPILSAPSPPEAQNTGATPTEPENSRGGSAPAAQDQEPSR